ncbi:MAG TPA: NADH-quinone oxidoreductase subunit J [Polyangia bacterium]|nr:NADH-quinone oxidoreductase subunit J [Polyangia bacterium]
MNPVHPAAAAQASSVAPGDAILFAVMAAWVTFFAIFTITRRNPVTAVMSLVATFFGLAAIYASLSAHFLAVLQVLVYAGAIMVLFIFVVMILNREEVAPLALRPMRLLGVAGAVYLLVVVWRVVLRDGDLTGAPSVLPESFGTVASIGDILFKSFLYPFEAISLLLLVAIVGGVVVSRSHQKEAAALRAADYRKQIEHLATHDYPGEQSGKEEPSAAAGGHN